MAPSEAALNRVLYVLLIIVAPLSERSDERTSGGSRRSGTIGI